MFVNLEVFGHGYNLQLIYVNTDNCGSFNSITEKVRGRVAQFLVQYPQLIYPISCCRLVTLKLVDMHWSFHWNSSLCQRGLFPVHAGKGISFLT